MGIPCLQAEARRKVLDYAPALYEACAPSEARQASKFWGEWEAAGSGRAHCAVCDVRNACS